MRQIALIFIALPLLAMAMKNSVDLSDVSQASPELKQVLDQFKTNITVKEGEIQRQTGFNGLKSTAEFGAGAIKIARIPDIVSFWVSSFPVDDATKSGVSEVIKSINFNKELSHGKYAQDFKFANKGTLYYLRVLFSAHESASDVAKWEKVMWTTSYKVAKPFMIVTKTICNEYECVEKDEVQYLKATVTEEHAKQLNDLDIPYVKVVGDKEVPVIPKKVQSI